VLEAQSTKDITKLRKDMLTLVEHMLYVISLAEPNIVSTSNEVEEVPETTNDSYKHQENDDMIGIRDKVEQALPRQDTTSRSEADESEEEIYGASPRHSTNTTIQLPQVVSPMMSSMSGIASAPLENSGESGPIMSSPSSKYGQTASISGAKRIPSMVEAPDPLSNNDLSSDDSDELDIDLPVIVQTHAIPRVQKLNEMASACSEVGPVRKAQKAAGMESKITKGPRISSALNAAPHNTKASTSTMDQRGIPANTPQVNSAIVRIRSTPFHEEMVQVGVLDITAKGEGVIKTIDRLCAAIPELVEAKFHKGVGNSHVSSSSSECDQLANCSDSGGFRLGR
jgi:hypothetical protein